MSGNGDQPWNLRHTGACQATVEKRNSHTHARTAPTTQDNSAVTYWGDDTKVRELSGSRSYSDARALGNWS
jgi:hypothetical protein